jgi:hypothetical protein
MVAVGSNKTVYQCFHPLPVPMAARITKYLNKYVRRGICLIYMSIFFISGALANFDLPDHGFLLLTCSTGAMERSTGNSYQAEALTNVLRYHTCRSSHPEDRKLQSLWLNFRTLPVSRIA